MDKLPNIGGYINDTLEVIKILILMGFFGCRHKSYKKLNTFTKKLFAEWMTIITQNQ